MACAQDLPQEVWTQILQHVSYKQRLCACALVCQKLSRAAAAATQSLHLNFGFLTDERPQLHAAFLSWTSSHGSSLTRLHLSSSTSHSSIRELACPHLLELSLSQCSVQLGASSDSVGLLHSCTALTQLVLAWPALLDGLAAGPPPQMLSAVAQMHSLSLAYTRLSEQPGMDGIQALEDRVLPHLTVLTSLSIERVAHSLESCFLQHISTIIRLKHLSVDGNGQTTIAALQGSERLTALEELDLSCCDLEPSCLSLTTCLTRLEIVNVTLLPEEQGGELGSAQLLQLLARLPALRVLELRSVRGEWPQQLSAYSALTASSNLQSLTLQGCHIQTAAWPHVFPAGRQLPNLESFAACLDDGGGDVQNAPRGPTPFDSTGIARLVSCCPALSALEIITVSTASLAPLRSLTALTQLCIGPSNPTTITHDLAALSQLQDLVVSVAVPGDDALLWRQHLVPLTALTNLTYLYCSLAFDFEEGEEEQDFPDQSFVFVVNEAPAGSPSDVWLQLLEKCAKDQAAQPVVISCMLRQLQQQRQQVAEQAVRLEQQEQQLAAARAEAAAEAAELRGQLREVLAVLRQHQM